MSKLMPMEPDELHELIGDYFGRGWCVVRGALAPATVAGFVAQLERELLAPTVAPEYASPPVALADPATWPRGTDRRVVPINPPGEGAHWDELERAPRLVGALDALLGAGGWTLPRNELDARGAGGLVGGVRHWYHPVVFPEGEES